MTTNDALYIDATGNRWTGERQPDDSLRLCQFSFDGHLLRSVVIPGEGREAFADLFAVAPIADDVATAPADDAPAPAADDAAPAEGVADDATAKPAPRQPRKRAVSTS